MYAAIIVRFILVDLGCTLAALPTFGYTSFKNDTIRIEISAVQPTSTRHHRKIKLPLLSKAFEIFVCSFVSLFVCSLFNDADSISGSTSPM
jgi:hypothetical protein